MNNTRIPVTILTGFLGAGKTTLLNEIIKKHKNYKFAVIENEFGDIPIDNELVVDVGEGIFELSNGCICCTLNGELSQTLLDLLASDKTFDHLLVETTGIAEPDAVAAAFVTDPVIQQHFRLDATVCFVDAHHAEEILEEREEWRKELFKAGNETLKGVMKYEAGIVLTLHPYGKDLKVNYHIHALVTEGGIDKNGR